MLKQFLNTEISRNAQRSAVISKFLYNPPVKQYLEPTQPPIRWALGALPLGVKQLGRESDYSPPSSAVVKKTWMYTSIPPYVFIAWYLVKHRNNFSFTFN
jgi:hypothetical protein